MRYSLQTLGEELQRELAARQLFELFVMKLGHDGLVHVSARGFDRDGSVIRIRGQAPTFAIAMQELLAEAERACASSAPPERSRDDSEEARAARRAARAEVRRAQEAEAAQDTIARWRERDRARRSVEAHERALEIVHHAGAVTAKALSLAIGSNVAVANRVLLALLAAGVLQRSDGRGYVLAAASDAAEQVIPIDVRNSGLGRSVADVIADRPAVPTRIQPSGGPISDCFDEED